MAKEAMRSDLNGKAASGKAASGKTAFARDVLNCDESTDLHIHTLCSDGTATPAEAVRWAKEKGCTMMSVTDHDGVGGIKEAAAEAEKIGIGFIAGIEMSTEHEFCPAGKSPDEAIKVEMHILGYGIDPGSRDLQTNCAKMRASREKRNEKLLEAIAKEGYDISKGDIPRANAGYISKPQIARAMIEKGYVKTIAEAFEEIFDTPAFKRISKEKTDAFEAIDLINGAGGTAVLAHPMKIKGIGKRGTEEMYDNLEKIISKLCAHGLGGLECCYSTHTKEEEICLLQIAEKYGLASTRGSDWHGLER